MGPDTDFGPGNIRVAHTNHDKHGGEHDTVAAATAMGATGNLATFKDQTAGEQRDGQSPVVSLRERQDQQDEQDEQDAAGQEGLQLGDFVGDHGAYQLSLTLLLFIRYVLLGLMANSGPLMTPDVTFYCQLPEREILMIMPNITLMGERERELEIKEEFKQICQIDLHLYQNQSHLLLQSNATSRGRVNFKTSPISSSSSSSSSTRISASANKPGLNATIAFRPIANLTHEEAAEFFSTRIRECTDFSYELTRDQGRTMTSEFDLVCDRDWLRSLFQSALSAAIVVAHVFWGTFSDKYGRFQAQRICLVVSFLAGLLSIFAWDFWSFTLTRSLCSFGDLGLVVSMTTVLVKLVGSSYRGCSVALVNFGYALGVSLLPYLVAYFEDFRLVIGFTLLCHMVTMPLVLATNESVRWLLTNRRFKEAKRELKRVARWNRRFRGTNRRHDKGSEPSATDSKERRMSTREHKRAFEIKFAEFVKQIEAQNMCDPVVAAESGRALRSPCPTPRIERPPRAVVRNRRAHAGSTIRTSVISGTRSLLPRGPIEQGGRFRFPAPPAIVTTPPGEDRPETVDPATGAEIHPPPLLPRVLARLEPERLELIKELESKAVDANERRRAHSSGLLNETLIRSLEMRHEQRLLDAKVLRAPVDQQAPSMSRVSSVGSDLLRLEAGAGAGATAANDARPPVGCSSIRDWHGQRDLSRAPPPPDCINLVAHQLSFVGRVSRLFRDKKLMIAVFTIVWTTFNSELLYTSFIIINLEVGEDLYLNYILGGCMEALAAIVASLLLSYSPRRISLIAFWLLISFACFGLSLAHIDSTWAVWMLALAKFSQSCLSSIATVAAYESFPTFLRQSGSGLVFTLGMLGSVFAPLIFAEFDDHAGMDRVLMTFSVSSLTAAALIYLFLNETRDCELM